MSTPTLTEQHAALTANPPRVNKGRVMVYSPFVGAYIYQGGTLAEWQADHVEVLSRLDAAIASALTTHRRPPCPQSIAAAAS